MNVANDRHVIMAIYQYKNVVTVNILYNYSVRFSSYTMCNLAFYYLLYSYWAWLNDLYLHSPHPYAL